MTLITLTLENFQGIRALTLDFGGRSATVYGDNATGKTTVFNAFTWLLFDKPSTGAKSFSPKTRGPEGELHHLCHSAEATLLTDSGRYITLKKTLREAYRKKRGSATDEFSGHTVEYSVDGVPVKEKEYLAAVSKLCGDTEKPKMLTMPDYFPEQLPWESRRRILLEICGDVSDSDIIAENPELSELPAFLRMKGSAEQFYTTDEFKKIACARKTEINRRLAEIPARIDEASKAIPDVEGLCEEDILRRISDLSASSDSLAEKKAQIALGGGTAELKAQLADLNTKIAEGRAAHIEALNKRVAEIDEKIFPHKNAADEKRRIVEDYRYALHVDRDKLEYVTTLRANLLSEYEAVSAEVWDEGSAVCPSCRRPLPEEEVARLREEFNLSKSERLADINHRGKTTASSAMISALEEDIRKLENRLAAEKAEAEAASESVKELEKQRMDTIAYCTAFESTEEYAALSEQIEDIKARLADENKGTAAALGEVTSEIAEVDSALRSEREKLSRLSAVKIQNKRISELSEQEKLLGGELEELEKGLYLCDIFTQKKVAALTERINNKFINVRFRLFLEQLNGGLRDDCEVMIPRADGTLVPYAFANNAARINAGLEIIGTLAAHFGLSLPIFIDNAESVTHLSNNGGQVIRLAVSEPDKKLRLEIDKI